MLQSIVLFCSIFFCSQNIKPPVEGKKVQMLTSMFMPLKWGGGIGKDNDAPSSLPLQLNIFCHLTIAGKYTKI